MREYELVINGGGPAYAQRYTEQVRELGIHIEPSTMVLHLHNDKSID